MESPPGGRCDQNTDTVATRRTPAVDVSERGEDFYLAIREDIELATREDFFMAMDNIRTQRPVPKRSEYATLSHDPSPLG
jgi:hypothetical protein